MKIIKTKFRDLNIYEKKSFVDNRGYFRELFLQKYFKEKYYRKKLIYKGR